MTTEQQKALSFLTIVATFAFAWWFTDWPPPPSGAVTWAWLGRVL